MLKKKSYDNYSNNKNIHQHSSNVIYCWFLSCTQHHHQFQSIVVAFVIIILVLDKVFFFFFTHCDQKIDQLNKSALDTKRINEKDKERERERERERNAFFSSMFRENNQNGERLFNDNFSKKRKKFETINILQPDTDFGDFFC